jgi:hypothetical protein
MVAVQVERPKFVGVRQFSREVGQCVLCREEGARDSQSVLRRAEQKKELYPKFR